MEKKTDFKALSSKAKRDYIWDYYRWHILIGIALLIFIVSLARHYLSYREPLLNVIMLNANASVTAEGDVSYAGANGFDEFLEKNGYDISGNPVSLSSNLAVTDESSASAYSDYEVLSVMIAAGGQDLFFGTGNTFLNYAEQGALMDLRTVVSEETLEKYKDHLIYSTDDGESESYPCAVELTNNNWIIKNGYYENCYFGVFARTENADASKQFADFLLNYE